MDTAQHVALAEPAPPRQRARLSGVAAWFVLIAVVTWWVRDDVGSGWPIVATIMAGLWVVREVNEAWVARDLSKPAN